jgi:malic enzyme
MDHRGLVHRGRTDVAADQASFAVDPGWFLAQGLNAEQLADPVAVASGLGATVLIGTTGTRGAFSEGLIREVAGHAEVPIILPLSNPTDRAEAEAGDVLTWTGGRALVATGGPSADVEVAGSHRVIGQANNVFIFPGVGLGSIVAETREVADGAFLVAARTLAALVSAERLAAGAIYPSIGDLRKAARAIAIAVVREARDSGLGRRFSDDEIPTAVDRAMWQPTYLPYVPE